MMATRNQHDKELDEYLQGGSSLSQAYHRHAEEPAAKLDRDILAASRRETGSGARRGIINPFGAHWMVPASLAAVLVIGVAVVMVLDEQTGISTTAPVPVLQQELEKAQKGADTAVQDKVPAAADGRIEGKRVPRESLLQKRAEPSMEAASSPAPLARQAPLAAPTAPAETGVYKGAVVDSEGTAEQWLLQIKDLIKQGRQDEANNLIERFRRRFPDYPLDRELDELTE